MATDSEKPRLLDQPFQPTLVAFPITFFTCTLLAFVAYLITGDKDWFRLGCIANAAGVATALLAAIPELDDWVAISRPAQAKRIGLIHLTLNLLVLTTFAINLGAQGAKLDAAAPPALVPVLLSAAGVALLLTSGYYGWSLVRSRLAGVAEAKERSPDGERRSGQARELDFEAPPNVRATDPEWLATIR